MELVRKTAVASAKPSADGRYRFTLSSGAVDRLGDVIEQKGWDLSDFHGHNVALWSHDPLEPVGQWHDVRVKGDKLEGSLELYPPGATPRSDMLRKVLAKNFPMAASVGFRPVERRPRPEGGSVYTRSRLVEASVVAVPANAACVHLAKSLGLEDLMSDIITKEAPPRDPPDDDDDRRPGEPEPDDDENVVRAATPPAALPVVAQPLDLRPVPSPVVRRGGARPYSVLNVVRSLAGDQSIDISREREVSQEIAYRTNSSRAGMHVPWMALLAATQQKAASTVPFPPVAPGTPTAGAWSNAAVESLLSTELVGAAIEKILNAGRLGVRIIASDERAIRIPRVSGKPAVTIVDLDGIIALSDVPVSATSIAPVEAGTRVEIRRSAMYAHDAESVIGRLILRAITEKIDEIVVQGFTGPPALPGLLTVATAAATASITSGGSLGAFLNEADLAAGGKRANVLMDAKSANFMANTAAWTGSSTPIAESSVLKDRTIVVAYGLPGTTTVPVLAGDFSAFVLALFGPAMTLESNPYAPLLWERGAFELRAIQDFSTGVIDASVILKSATTTTAPTMAAAPPQQLEGPDDDDGEGETTRTARKATGTRR